MDENHQDRTNQKSIIKEKGMNWGFADKSFWEWIVLLGTLLAALGAIAIPFVVTIIGLNFTQQQAQLSIAASEKQHQTDLQIAQDQQQATTLQTYIDNIQDLLLSHNLLKSKPDDEVAILARARTLTALQGLDPDRKGRLLRFLYEAKLIGFGYFKTYEPIIDLAGANLSFAHLSFADLTGADLDRVFLTGADLSDADLTGADLTGAHLSDADLRSADLSDADLTGAHLNRADFGFTHLFVTAGLSRAGLSRADFANLNNAKLNGADLWLADLSGAHLTQYQLDEVFTCLEATLPKGLTCHHDTSI